jgi:hypothetical protein
MPSDALAEPECQLGTVLAPRPFGSKVRDNRLQAILRLVLFVHDKIIEEPHHRQHGRDCHFFQDRKAGRTVTVVDFQNSTVLLRRSGLGAQQGNGQRTRCGEHAKVCCHLFRLPLTVGGAFQAVVTLPPALVLPCPATLAHLSGAAFAYRIWLHLACLVRFSPLCRPVHPLGDFILRERDRGFESAFLQR